MKFTETSLGKWQMYLKYTKGQSRERENLYEMYRITWEKTDLN